MTFELFRISMLEVGQAKEESAELGCCTAIVWRHGAVSAWT